jgi:hypothetical protein
MTYMDSAVPSTVLSKGVGKNNLILQFHFVSSRNDIFEMTADMLRDSWSVLWKYISCSGSSVSCTMSLEIDVGCMAGLGRSRLSSAI